jgi:hypothetical protein
MTGLQVAAPAATCSPDLFPKHRGQAEEPPKDRTGSNESCLPACRRRLERDAVKALFCSTLERESTCRRYHLLADLICERAA